MPPLLMIHGMWSRPSAFTTLRAELEAAGIASVAVTLPHHDVPPGSPAPAVLGTLKLADYVAALEREVADLGESPVILGHSMGGLLAQLLAARVAPRGLILLSTAPSAQASSMSLDAFWTMRRVTGRWGWWKAPTLLDADSARYGVYNGVPEAEIRPALADLTWDSGPVLAQLAAPWLDGDRGARVDYARLAALPVLVITGLEDRIVPPATSRKTARLLSAAGAAVDYEEWPNVGHWLFHDAVRPRVGGRIARFMAALG
jgi:pimeloyl-ACP methyl ester carboxylesterase